MKFDWIGRLFIAQVAICIIGFLISFRHEWVLSVANDLALIPTMALIGLFYLRTPEGDRKKEAERRLSFLFLALIGVTQGTTFLHELATVPQKLSTTLDGILFAAFVVFLAMFYRYRRLVA